MNETKFDKAFKMTVGHEGTYTRGHADRGNWTTGRVGKGVLKGTKFGISAMSYPHLDIKNLTVEQAKEIYREDFWNAIKCDDFPAGVDYLVFDTAVNSGKNRAKRLLQEALGVAVDGVIGPNTLRQARAAKGSNLITEFSARRAVFYANISTFPIYGLGWMRRLTRTTAEALTMSRESTISSVGIPEPVVAPLDQSKGSLFGKLFRKV